MLRKKEKELKSKTKGILSIKFVVFFSAFIGISLGVLVTILVKKYTAFTFSNELDYLNLTSIIVTIGVTIYIASILERRKVVQEGSKEIYSEFFDNYLKEFKDGIEGLIQTKDKLSNYTMFFKLKRMKVYNMKEFIDDQRFLDDCDCLSCVISCVNDIYNLTTGDTVIDKSGDGNVFLNAEKKQLVRIKLIEFEKSIYRTIFEINKA